MRARPILVLLLMAGAFPGVAQADSYIWGGRVGRFSVSVYRLGFAEGAGTDGWEPESARRLAAWGARIAAVIPPGRRVEAVFGLDDDAVALEVHDGSDDRLLDRIETSVTALQLADDDYAELMRVLAARFGGTPGTTAPAARPIYTVQLAALPDARAAAAVADRLRARGVAARGSFYHETCAPCFARDPKVLEGQSGDRTVYRVVSGVFDSWRAAAVARQQLERRTGRRAFVRRL